MPTIKIPTAPYRFFFYSNELQEPAHVHVSHAGREAKFWIAPIRLANNDGFSGHELKTIKNLTQKYEEEIATAWEEYFA